jgi:hypothetical protein
MNREIAALIETIFYANADVMPLFLAGDGLRLTVLLLESKEYGFKALDRLLELFTKKHKGI